MAVKIRMKRMGRKHEAFFRICAVDAAKPRNGRVIEQLGWLNPNIADDQAKYSLNRERIEYWLSIGAKPSNTVADLLRKSGMAAG